jgi:pSer/pThr/pTyr-binding forkhead associated (FHA) protein
MAECPGCGASVGSDVSECPSCGANLADPTASFDPVVPIEAPVSGLPVVTDGPVLIVRKGPQPGERFFVDRPRLDIGRDPKSDIFLNDMTVSRTHAIVTCVADEVSVADAGSLNGTYVNGEIVENARLADGDVVQIGTFQMVFVSATGIGG